MIANRDNTGYSPKRQESNDYTTYKSSDYSAQKAADYISYKSSDYTDYKSTNDHKYTSEQTVSSTPIMSRRRLSSSPKQPSSSSSASASSLNTPLKPLTSATPASQSKLASHAFTMSRSSNEDEDESRSASIGSSVSDFRRKYEEEYIRSAHSGNTVNTSSSLYDNANNFEMMQNTSEPRPYYSYEQSPVPIPAAVSKSIPSTNAIPSDLREIVSSIVESQTTALKNDLQNLHIELIKQSVAQQSSFKSLLETYLPLTGKLMESLAETREENERLKMRIEELERNMVRERERSKSLRY